MVPISDTTDGGKGAEADAGCARHIGVVHTPGAGARRRCMYYGDAMFVKWQRRRETYAYYQETVGDLLMASLVESRRVNGKPRHRLIAYLGSIREKHAQGGPEKAVCQDNFWRDVARRLGRRGLLGNRISPVEHAKIEEALAKRVRRPAQAEIDQSLARTRKELEGYLNVRGERIYPEVTDEMVRKHASY